MALTQLGTPYPVFTDTDGKPLDAGFLYFGVQNQNPETNPITVYYDAALTQPAAQPLRTSNGYVMRNGSPAILYADSLFSVTVRNAQSELVIYAPVSFSTSTTNLFRGPISFDNIAALLADTVLSYAVNVTAGDTVVTNQDQFSYVVAAAGASDDDVQTAGGVKLYVKPDASGFNLKAFGATGDGATNDIAALQAADARALADGGKLYAPAGDYLISETWIINSTLEGDGEQLSRFLTNAATFDAIDVADTADFLRIQGIGIRNNTGTSTGSGLTLVRNNNNVILEAIEVTGFAVGFNLEALTFAQNLRMCRATLCTTGFLIDGRDTDDTQNGTTLVLEQCYAVGATTAFNISFVSSVALIQPIVDVDPSTTACIVTNGVGALNVYDFHFEGTPGGNGEYFRFTTSGTLGQSVNLFGGYVDGADLTGLTFEFMRVDGNNDDVEVNIYGVGSRNITNDGNDAFQITSSSGVIQLNLHGFTWPSRSVNTAALSGDYFLKDYTPNNAIPVLSGSSTIVSGGNINTGKGATPFAIVQIYDTDDTAVPTTRAVVADQFSNGEIKVRFYDPAGAEVTATPLAVAWLAW